jgi:hypothetical protein
MESVLPDVLKFLVKVEDNLVQRGGFRLAPFVLLELYDCRPRLSGRTRHRSNSSAKNLCGATLTRLAANLWQIRSREIVRIATQALMDLSERLR